MGPLRVGLTLAALPVPAMAEVCGNLRPAWDGTPVSIWMEPALTFSNPLLFLLLILVMPGSYFRHTAWQMGGIFAASFLLLFVSTPIWMADGKGIYGQAISEGCVAPPYLSTAFAAAITLFAVIRAIRRLRKKER